MLTYRRFTVLDPLLALGRLSHPLRGSLHSSYCYYYSPALLPTSPLPLPSLPCMSSPGKATKKKEPQRRDLHSFHLNRAPSVFIISTSTLRPFNFRIPILQGPLYTPIERIIDSCRLIRRHSFALGPNCSVASTTLFPQLFHPPPQDVPEPAANALYCDTDLLNYLNTVDTALVTSDNCQL